MLDNTFKVGSKFEKKIHGLLSRIFGLQGYYSKKGTRKLLKYMDVEKPDVVRLGNLHSNFINFPMLFKYLSENDIPTVITLDDCFFFTGKCCHYTVDECYRWRYECGECPRKKKDNVSWFFDRTNKMLNDKRDFYRNIPRLAVVGVSHWISNEAKKSILSTACYIETIYNWVDTDIFYPVDSLSLKYKYNLEIKFIILGVASEWSDKKGLNYFIQLAERLLEDEVIILVGKLSDSIDLPSNIKNIEQTDDINELVDYYNISDVFLQLSLEETFGKVVAESLSCGTPVIAFNSTANPELIGYRCGYTLEYSEFDNIREYIDRIKKNKKNYYTTSCREYALKKFSKIENITKYISLFEKLKEKNNDL